MDLNQSPLRRNRNGNRNRKRKLNMMMEDDEDIDMNSNLTQCQTAPISRTRQIWKRARYHSISLKITIKMGNISKDICLDDVNPDCTIKQLSFMICNTEKLNPETTTIIYPFQLKNASLLNDKENKYESTLLRYFGVSNGCSICVSLKFSNDLDSYNYASSIKGSMIIFVKTLKGKLIWLACKSCDSLSDLKSYIYSCEGIPIQQQRFIFKNKPMDINKSLSENGVYHLNTIHLVLRLRGGGSFGFGARHNMRNDIMYDDNNDKCEDLEEIEIKMNKLNVGNNNYLFWRCCPGLNYCGRCLNKDCKAFNQPIIKNRGFGMDILPFMEDKQHKILCPGCDERFELNGFTLYSCDARLRYKLINGESKELMFKPRRNEYIDFNEIKEYGMFQFNVCYIGHLNKA